MKRALFTVFLGLTITTVAAAQSTVVPGQQKTRSDADNNGYADVGVAVTGKYVSVYAYDANGDYFWDLGDGRIYSTVPSVADLDRSTLTRCNYQVQYRAEFDNNPFMDRGWIINAINCTGVERGTYVYLIVSEDDPRYTGNPDWAIWGNWEYHVLVEGGNGNLVHTLTNPHGGG